MNIISGLRLAESELVRGNGPTEQLVDKPEPICIEDVTLDKICEILGLPGKLDGIDDGAIDSVVQAGRITEVAL